ncbi:MAG: asparagine synthase C-terminal domain-containing protein [Methermicoccaceae archaeon]
MRLNDAIAFPSEYIADEESAVSVLRGAIEKAIAITAHNIHGKRAAIAFSGGLDSSLLAALLDVPLVSIALGGSRDERWTRASARMLGAQHRTEVYVVGLDEVERAVGEVVSVLDTCSVLDVSIALPLYLLSEKVSERFDVLITGQGADELFGGYERYERTDNVAACMVNDLNGVLERGVLRDKKVADVWGITLEMPYLSPIVIRAALSISFELKLKRTGSDVVRKYVLRRAALPYLPEEVAHRKKHALQYSTGLMRALSRLAAQHGFTNPRRISHYLESLKA